MADKCILDSQRDCLGLAEAMLLKKRIEDLEEAQTKSSKFREDFYNWQKEQIIFQTQTVEQIKAMNAKSDTTNEKIDKVIKWQEDQQQKPAKRWESIVDKVLMLFVGAVVAYVLAKIGL